MMKFELGGMFVTRGVDRRMKKEIDFHSFVFESLTRFMDCDWGDMTPGDRKLNDEAVRAGEGRIHGSYTYKGDREDKIWIITESDRSATTVLFPDEY